MIQETMPVPFTRRNEYAVKLQRRFADNRFLCAVAYDTTAHVIERAVIYIYDLHDVDSILLPADRVATDDQRFWTRPVCSMRLAERMMDGSPNAMEIRRLVHAYMDAAYPNWGDDQAGEDVCLIALDGSAENQDGMLPQLF